MRCLVLVAAVLATACLDSPTTPDVVTGTWGGEHVRLTTTADGGQLEFDCAHGAMTAALVPQADGRFNVPGYYVAEQGGPVGEDSSENRRPASYTGRVSGTTLALSFTVGDQPFGPFTLMRDRLAIIHKCL